MSGRIGVRSESENDDKDLSIEVRHRSELFYDSGRGCRTFPCFLFVR
ncbi:MULTISPECIES: hypothetical protein [Candidatus Ichthyocystis]|nr:MULTISPECIES: hypothetical protein [Ichthyocystis]